MEYGVHEEFRHKGRLQEFAQRASMSLPVYQTFNEGSQHLPQFRSNVVVDGTQFVSPCVFQKSKHAEQHVAKFALENILTKIKQEGVTLVDNDVMFCKTILHEYAAKTKTELPNYTTSRVEGSLPIFITTVAFDGNIYSGYAGRNKKEAEQLAAQTVIKRILGQTDKSIAMVEIIKSKDKIITEFRKCITSSGPQGNEIPPTLTAGDHSGDSLAKRQDNNMPLVAGDHSGDTLAKGQDILSGGIEPQNDNAASEVCLYNHSGNTAAKEKDTRTEPTDGNLPAPTVQQSDPPAAVNPKERSSCEVSSEVVGGSSTLPVVQKNNQPEGSTVEPVNPVSSNSCLEKVVQVKEEVPSEDTPVPPSQLQTLNPSGSGKRSRKKHNKGSNSKKMRPDE